MPTVREIYDGSDGAATTAYYARLKSMGTAGEVGMNLFRAQKSSARAKVYRGGVKTGNGKRRFKDMAYERKEWSMSNLCDILDKEAHDLGIPYGWKKDPHALMYKWVFYVDIPTGQVSFHTATRGKGPDYFGEWDGVGMSAERIMAFCDALLDGTPMNTVYPEPIRENMELDHQLDLAIARGD